MAITSLAVALETPGAGTRWYVTGGGLAQTAAERIGRALTRRQRTTILVAQRTVVAPVMLAVPPRVTLSATLTRSTCGLATSRHCRPRGTSSPQALPGKAEIRPAIWRTVVRPALAVAGRSLPAAIHADIAANWCTTPAAREREACGLQTEKRKSIVVPRTTSAPPQLPTVMTISSQ